MLPYTLASVGYQRVEVIVLTFSLLQNMQLTMNMKEPSFKGPGKKGTQSDD